MLLLTTLLTFTPVQTRLAQWGVDYVNKRYDTHIELEGLRYSFPNNLVLSELYTPDHHGDTLIYASELSVGIFGFGKDFFSASDADIEDLKFYYLQYEGEEEYNLDEFIAKFSSGPSDPDKPPFAVSIGDIDISNGRFRYEDFNCDSCVEFFLQRLNIEASDFELEGQYVSLDVEELNGVDRYSVAVQSLRSEFAYLEKEMRLHDLELQTPHTYLRGDATFYYDSTKAMRNFVDLVRMEGTIEEGRIRSQDIRYFAPEMPDFGDFELKGSVAGIVNDMELSGIDLRVGEESRVEGDFHFSNTTSADSLFMRAIDMDLSTYPGDIRFIAGLFEQDSLPAMIDKIGAFNLRGDFTGTLADFQTDAVLRSRLGGLSLQATLANLGSNAPLRYRGRVELNRFQLGELLGRNDLGMVSTQLKVDGRGLDPQTMNTSLDGEVSQLFFKDYNYQNISIDGDIAGGLFEGELQINDPNLQFDFSGSASFGQDTSSYNFEAKIVKAELNKLQLTKDTISTVTGEIKIDLKALDYNQWTGNILVFNTTYENSNNFYFFQDIEIVSNGMADTNLLAIRSNILDARIAGKYTYDGIVKAAKSQLSKYIKTMDPVKAPADHDFHFDLDINNTRILTEIFIPELEIDPGTRLDGRYHSDSSFFDISIESPGFDFKRTDVRNLSLSYQGDTAHTEVNFDLAKVILNDEIEIDSISLGNYYYRDTLNYNLSWILRDSVDSRGDLNGFAIQRGPSEFLLSIYSSDFNVGYQNFSIKGGNRFYVDTTGIRVEDFVIGNQSRSLVVNGNISDDPNEILRLRLQGFGMDLVDYFIRSRNTDFDGHLEGELLLTQLLGQPKFAADLHIDSLSMNGSTLGDLAVTSDWSVRNDTINLQARLLRGELETFVAEGYYQPDSTGSISFDLGFDRLFLQAFNPMVEGLLENLRGYANGQLKVRGTTGKPVVTGELSLPRAAFTVSFLQVDYNFNETPRVTLTEDKITFNELQLRDTDYRTEGILRGEIRHKHLRDFELDLEVEAREMLVLNTTAVSEDPYYGTAFVDGRITMTGPVDELVIDADLTSRRNSRFVLPLAGSTEVSESDFVTFVTPNQADTLQLTPTRRLNLDRGVALNFNLDLNQSATVEILIDEEGGNKLAGTGNGDILLRVAPYGEIELYGSYTIADGYYNFALQEGLITRRFDVLRGGTINWNGDPLGALINLTARYSTRADPSPLVTTYEGGRTLVYVDMNLSGELMNPEIDFTILTPRATSSVQSAINNRMTDPGGEYTQVFALLTLGQFIGNNNTGGALTASSGRNITMQGVTTLAETFLNQFTGKTSFSFDYQSGSAADPANVNNALTRDELDVGVSRQLFDDRITVNGSVGIPINDQTQQSQIAGDFEVEYNITRDGRFRAKVFNRAIQSYSSNLAQQNYQQGVGVFYRVDFNSLSDLWREIFGRNEDEDGESEDLPAPEASDDGKLP